MLQFQAGIVKRSLFEVPHSPTSLLLPGDEESSTWEVLCLAFLAFLSCSPPSPSLSVRPKPSEQSAGPSAMSGKAGSTSSLALESDLAYTSRTYLIQRIGGLVVWNVFEVFNAMSGWWIPPCTPQENSQVQCLERNEGIEQTSRLWCGPCFQHMPTHPQASRIHNSTCGNLCLNGAECTVAAGQT